MYCYPFETSLAFIVDDEVTAHIIRQDIIKNGNTEGISQEVMDVLTSDDFAAAAADKDHPMHQLLAHCGLFVTSDALELLDDLETTFLSGFSGVVQYLHREGACIRTESLEDDCLLLLDHHREITPFTKAYDSMDEFIAEVREQLIDTGYLPENFKLEEHIVSVSGTYAY